MPYSHFNDQKNLSPEKVLITVIIKKDGSYYLIAEGILSNQPFIKILTHYKNYFLPILENKVNKYTELPIEETFEISVSQFNAVANQKWRLDKELANCLKCALDKQKKSLAIQQLQQIIDYEKEEAIQLAIFKEKKRRYLILTGVDAIREGLDWATMPLLLFWIPISFATLGMTALILLIAATAVTTLAVAAYTIKQQYQEDKSELKKLTKNLVDNPLELPQLQELTYAKDFFLPAFVTATTLFSFFWVTYDILVVLGIISSISMPILPLIVIPICLAVSLLFAGFHFYKLSLENQLYEEAYNEKNNDSLEPPELNSENLHPAVLSQPIQLEPYPQTSEKIEEVFKPTGCCPIL